MYMLLWALEIRGQLAESGSYVHYVTSGSKFS